VALLAVALLAPGSAQAASKADVSVSAAYGGEGGPRAVDFQIIDQSLAGITSVQFSLQGQPITSIHCGAGGWKPQVSPTGSATCVNGSFGPGQILPGYFIWGGSLPPTAGTLTVGYSTGTEQFPFTIAGTPPSSTPCTCLNLTASIAPGSITVATRTHKTTTTKASIAFTLDWNLACSGGSGAGCTGSIAVVPRAEGGWAKALAPSDTRVHCTGECSGSNAGSSRIRLVAAFRNATSVQAGLGGKRVLLRIQRHCGTKALPDEDLSIAFNRLAKPDAKKSKLG
jgi:hypothetical protein